MNKVLPIVKWAGGKRQLISELLAKVPNDFNVYHEFFFGGGALFFELYNRGRIKKAYLSDSNPRLINLYDIVKTQPLNLIDELKSGKYINDEKTFYKIREWKPIDKVEQAAQFIYLNKTAYNGLYRENSSGKFNVPFGKYKNPKILDKENLLAVSEALSVAELNCGDFSQILKCAKKDDFAYFDPPYVPLNETSKFTSYTAKQFSFEDQKRLKQVFDALDKKGVKVLLSNSNTEFVRNLFDASQINTVIANRMINCKAKGRGAIKELLITGVCL